MLACSMRIIVDNEFVASVPFYKKIPLISEAYHRKAHTQSGNVSIMLSDPADMNIWLKFHRSDPRVALTDAEMFEVCV